MTATAYPVKNPVERPLHVYDGTDFDSITLARYNMNIQALRGLARAGLLWRSAGVPTYAATIPEGSRIIDTTNKDLYVIDAGACNKITAS